MLTALTGFPGTAGPAVSATTEPAAVTTRPRWGRPTHIKIRAPFVYTPRADERGPVVPLLLQTRGRQLLFDAQCRHSPETPVRNPRSIVRRADDRHAGRRELVLCDVRPSK